MHSSEMHLGIYSFYLATMEYYGNDPTSISNILRSDKSAFSYSNTLSCLNYHY